MTTFLMVDTEINELNGSEYIRKKAEIAIEVGQIEYIADMSFGDVQISLKSGKCIIGKGTARELSQALLQN